MENNKVLLGLIKEYFEKPIKHKKCSCGCNRCHIKNGLELSTIFINEHKKLIIENQDATISNDNDKTLKSSIDIVKNYFDWRKSRIGDKPEYKTLLKYIDSLKTKDKLTQQDIEFIERYSKKAGIDFDKLNEENKSKTIGAGILCLAEDTKKFLVVKRSSNCDSPNTWCGAGGKVEPEDEDLKATAIREFSEEVGYSEPMKMRKIHTHDSPELEFTNFIGIVPCEFEPNLDTTENTEYKWLTKQELIDLPNKHFGLEEVLNKIFKKETMNENFNPIDIITLDVPLLIRLLEYSREDAKDDLDLHKLAENLIKLSSMGGILTMEDYKAILNNPENINEIESEDELKREISEYQKNSAEIEALQKALETKLKEIADKNKAENNRLKLIIDYMDRFNISKTQADDWVATLENKLKYSRPQPSYKELWEAALSKLNAQTVKVMKQLEHAQVDAKSKETEKKFKIDKLKEGILDNFKNFISKLKGFFNQGKEYIKTVKELPKLEGNLNENDLKESTKSDKLSELIMNSINEIDENLSYKDLALAVSKILKDEYGSHNYQPFLDELKSNLEIE
jgi:8-oxo-dGTP pyrophosphatase MutT (NUDIX family)